MTVTRAPQRIAARMARRRRFSTGDPEGRGATGPRLPASPRADTRRSRSYSGQLRGALAVAREARGLYGVHADVAEQVAAVLESLRRVEDLLRTSYGFELRDRRVLDVGAGQLSQQMAFLSLRNDVTGIDLEVVAHGPNPLPYLRMLRINGPRRTAKTVARKLVGVDRRYRREFARQLGLSRFPDLSVLQMDACDLSFGERTFDVVYSHSVFHHIARPERAMDEIRRVLRPGGVAYISLHLYTSDTGSLDPRIMRGDPHMPLWPHLRPGHADGLLQNAYLNKLRLSQWRALFAERWPGCRIILGSSERSRLEPAALRLKQQGELEGYELEELVSRSVAVVWQKPA